MSSAAMKREMATRPRYEKALFRLSFPGKPGWED